MSEITETISYEVTASKVVQVRIATTVTENGEQLSVSYHRHCIAPGDDYSQENDAIRAICASAHTPEAIIAYAASMPLPFDSKELVLAQARELRDKIFSRLNGIQQDLEWNKARGILIAAVVDPQVDGIMTAKAGLKDITAYSTVAAATTGAETIAALTARYGQLVAALYTASPYAYTAFNGLDV